jgi:hypothetical protein
MNLLRAPRAFVTNPKKKNRRDKRGGFPIRNRVREASLTA